MGFVFFIPYFSSCAFRLLVVHVVSWEGLSADGTLPRRSKVFFFYFVFSSSFISHHQHSIMIMLERSWPALLSFPFSIIIFSSSFLPVCLVWGGLLVISFGDPPLLGLQVLSVRLSVPWLHLHPVTQTLQPPGLVLGAGQDRPGQVAGSCLPGECRELVWKSTAVAWGNVSCSCSPELCLDTTTHAWLQTCMNGR